MLDGQGYIKRDLLNDVTVDPETGDAYITDSFVPIIWRAPKDASADEGLDPWLDLTRTPIRYKEGEFNLNGIVATPDGSYLLTVQTNTGNLYRIDTGTEKVKPVDLGGEKLVNGDGLLLKDHTLYIVRNQLDKTAPNELITKVLLDDQFLSGQVEGSVSDPTFDFPTTAALAGELLLVVNSQFDEGGPVCPGYPTAEET